MPQDHWPSGLYFDVEESDAEGQIYETLAIRRSLALACAAFAAAIAEKRAGRFMNPQSHARGAAASGGRLVSAVDNT